MPRKQTARKTLTSERERMDDLAEHNADLLERLRNTELQLADENNKRLVAEAEVNRLKEELRQHKLAVLALCKLLSLDLLQQLNGQWDIVYLFDMVILSP